MRTTTWRQRTCNLVRHKRQRRLTRWPWCSIRLSWMLTVIWGIFIKLEVRRYYIFTAGEKRRKKAEMTAFHVKYVRSSHCFLGMRGNLLLIVLLYIHLQFCLTLSLMSFFLYCPVLSLFASMFNSLR